MAEGEEEDPGHPSEPAEPEAGSEGTLDFFVSYTGVNRGWAEWIAWQLEEASYRVRIQAWHFGSGSHFVAEMQRAATAARRTIAVLSPAYERSAFASAEWQAAFARDPLGLERRLIPVRVEDYTPTGLLRSIVYVDLVGLSDTRARERLLSALGQLESPSGGKPTSEPAFPGQSAGEHEPRAGAHRAPGFPSKLPAIWTVPLDRNPFFRGRDSDLAALHEAFHDLERAPDTAPWVLCGLGGVGKTQLAVEYAYSARGRYRAVLWVAERTGRVELAGAEAAELSSSPRAALQAGFSALLEDLVPAERVSTLPREQPERVAAVRRWLAEHDDWLLVVDNLDTPAARDAALGLLPRLRRGHVLFTSRLGHWPVKCHVHALPLLPDEAAKALLLERVASAAGADDAEVAVAIVTALGRLPLALEQAGATIVKRRWSLSRYLQRLETARQRLLSEPAAGGTELEGPRAAVATTWAITEAELSLAARTVLRLLSFFAPADLPRRVLEAVATPELESDLGRLASSLEGEALDVSKPADSRVVMEGPRLENALLELADYSLVAVEPETVSVHPLVLEVQQWQVPGQARDAWGRVAFRLIAAAHPGDPADTGSWKEWRALEPHVLATVVEGGDEASAELAVRLLHSLGAYLNAQARWQDAEPVIRRALLLCERAFGPEPPQLSALEGNLAQVLEATSRWREAEPLMRHALAMDEKRLGRGHPTVALRLNNLAQLLLATGRLSEAEPLLRRALAIAEAQADRDSPEVAVYSNALALLLRETTRFGEAEALLRRALSIDEKTFGAQHPRVATRLNNLASVLLAVGRWGEATPLLRRALAIDEQIFDGQHPRVASDLSHLSGVLQAAQQWSEAESTARRALAIDERFCGEMHPRVAADLSNLARVLRATRRSHEAEPLLRRALEISEATLDQHHPHRAAALNALAQLLQDERKLDEAEPLLRRALLILELQSQRTGHEHEHRSIAQDNYRSVLRESGMSEGEVLQRLEQIEEEARRLLMPATAGAQGSVNEPPVSAVTAAAPTVGTTSGADPLVLFLCATASLAYFAEQRDDQWGLALRALVIVNALSILVMGLRRRARARRRG